MSAEPGATTSAVAVTIGPDPTAPAPAYPAGVRDHEVRVELR